MRFVLVFSFSLISYLGFSQISDTLVAKKFWSDNIQAIIQLDKAKILSQTNFPLEIRIGDELWDKAKFTSELDNVFTETLRNELKAGSFENIDAWKMFEDESETYMVVCFSTFNEFSILVLMFKEFNGIWKLYGIDMQSDEFDIEEDDE